MYLLRRRYRKFCKLSYEYYALATAINNNLNLGNRTKYLYLSGIINSLWQTWNGYWRTFWLANLLGGIDFQQNIIYPVPCTVIDSKSLEGHALFYLMYILGKKRKPVGCISASYQETTWGAREQIEKLAYQLRGPQDKILSAMAVYGDVISHLQIVRNAAIHLDKDNLNKIKTEVMPFYVETSIEYPTDMLFFTRLPNGRSAFEDWLDNLKVFLTFT